MLCVSRKGVNSSGKVVGKRVIQAVSLTSVSAVYVHVSGGVSGKYKGKMSGESVCCKNKGANRPPL